MIDKTDLTKQFELATTIIDTHPALVTERERTLALTVMAMRDREDRHSIALSAETEARHEALKETQNLRDKVRLLEYRIKELETDRVHALESEVERLRRLSRETAISLGRILDHWTDEYNTDGTV